LDLNDGRERHDGAGHERQEIGGGEEFTLHNDSVRFVLLTG